MNKPKFKATRENLEKVAKAAKRAPTINCGNMDEIAQGHFDEAKFKEAMKRVHELELRKPVFLEA